MKIKLGRGLGIAAFGGVAALALLHTPSIAVASPVAAEKGLLGIRILQSYRMVLNKYGQPDRIYRAGETVNMDLAIDSTGSLTGGIRGIGNGTMTAGMGGGMAGGRMGGGMPGGMMGGRMGSGMAGGMMGGRMGGGMPGMPPGMMQGGYPGMGGMGQGGGMMGGRMGQGGFPGMGGMGQGGGMMGGGMMGGGMMGGGMMGGGMAASGSSMGGNTFAAAGGFIWVYFFPKKELVYEFFFNKDGRVEGILERGRYLGQSTSRGLGLGAPLRSLYTVYGWPDSIDTQGPSLAVNYNEKFHTYFSVLNNKVIGIAVFLRESQHVSFFDSGTGGTGGFGGGAPRGAGGMMGGGMMGGKLGGNGGGAGKAD